MTITDVVMFDGDSNVQLGGELMKFHYPKLTVMHGVEHIFYLFFNNVSIIPSESDDCGPQGNIKLIWFWHISQNSFYI